MSNTPRSGYPLLFCLHGFTGSPKSFDDLLVRLPERRALCPALIGHGARAEAVARFEDEVERLAGLLGDEPVELVGYSLGARLGLGLLARHPELILRATLIGVHPGLGSEAERAERRRADAERAELLETCGIEAFVDAWQARPLFASQSRLPKALLERRRRERLSHAPRELARALRATGLSEMPDYRAKLAELKRPVTLMAGELDRKFSELASELATTLPSARVVIAPNAGHDLLLERPDLVALEIERDAF